MLSSTVALAAAAANQFPEPFVKSGSADVAVVYGSNVNVAQTDIDSALNVGKKLNNYVVADSVAGTTTTTVSGEGDKYDLEKTSTKFHIGDYALNVVSTTVKDDKMPTLLTSGKYLDTNNDEFDYDQQITLGNLSVTMFNDNNYKADTPTVGVKVASGSHILNYTLKFNDNPNMTKMETTDLSIMGKQYYVLDVSGVNKLTLLDSAESVVLKEGETKTVSVNGKTYELSISFIGETEVKLKVNDQITTSIAEAQTYKLKDGAYIGIKDISVQNYAGGSKQVEFGIGAGKLILTDGLDIELNEQSVDRLKADIQNISGNLLSQVVLEWKADGDQFAAENSTIVMPGFNTIKVGFEGVNYPQSEEIKVEVGGDDYIVLEDFPLLDTTETINLIYTTNNVNFSGIGKDADEQLLVGDNNITFIDGTHDYFVASWSDGKDSESYLVKASNFGTTSTTGVNKTTISYLKDGVWTTGTEMENGEETSIGSVELTVEKINRGDNPSAIIIAGSNANFNTLYSKEGMKLILPWINTTAVTAAYAGINYTAATQCLNFSDGTTSLGAGEIGYNQVTTWTNGTGSDIAVTCTSYPASVNLQLWEKDKDGDLGGTSAGSGKNINLTLGFNSATTPQVSVTDIVGESVTAEEIGNTEVFRTFAYSDLATEILWNKNGDQDIATLINHGSETTAKVFLASSGIVVGSSDGVTETGIPQLKDTEVATKAANKNLIVVGGSCINTVAATLLGSSTPLCGADFTNAAKTKVGKEVGAGSYLISTFASPYNTGKVAMLVAGYDAQDTVNAATYLTTQAGNVSTAAGDSVVNGAKVTVSSQ